MNTLGDLASAPGSLSQAASAAIATKSLSGVTAGTAAYGPDQTWLYQSGSLVRVPLDLVSAYFLGRCIDVSTIYPTGHGPIGSTQTPSSLGYSTIAAYIADLPTRFQAPATSFSFATPLVTDQCGWIAWQTAANYIFDNWGGADAVGSLIFSQPHVVNRTITVNAAGIEIRGVGVAPGNGGPSIAYNGSGGTIDAPVAILDLYNYDEFNYANGHALNTDTSGIKAYLSNFTLLGKSTNIATDMFSTSQNVSGYVSGIRLRAFNGCRIQGVAFGGVLYDGIYSTAPSLFVEINGCGFHGVHRDGISFCGFAGNFTTETWITHNDFGFVGRYAIICDFNGSTTATPNILYNSFEHVYPQSFYLNHREWFVCGVAAGICLHGCDDAIVSGNYWEGVVGNVGGNIACDAAIHLHKCLPITITDDNLQHLYVTSEDVNQVISTAGLTYQNGKGGGLTAVTGITKANPGVVHAVAHGLSNGDVVRMFNVSGMTQVNGPAFTVTVVDVDHVSIGVDTSAYGTYTTGGRITTGTRYLDITDTRNYRVGYTSNFGQVSRVTLRALPSLAKIIFADDFTLDQTTFSSIEDSGFGFWKVATTNASARDGKKVQPLATSGAAIYANSPNCVAYRNAGNDSRLYGQFDTFTQSGNFKCRGPTAPTWAATTAYSDTFTADYLFSVQQLIQPTSGNWTGFLYQYTTAGISGSSEPIWPTTIGATVSDGTATLTCVARSYLSTENLRAEVMEFGMRRFQGNAAPTAGRFARGDKMIYSVPDAGGGANPFIGQVATAGGVPGTWKTFGAISA